MEELTIITLCQTLANLTHNRCSLVENSNTCRCIGDVIHPISSTVGVNTSAPEIMLSEVCLIFFVLGIWLSAIGFGFHQYKSLRRLETQVHYCMSRKDPLNIGNIKIVEHEQDSIIYKKKRYSTLLDTHINSKELKTMHYVQQYLPKNLIPEQDDLFQTDMESNRYNSKISYIQRAESARYATGLTVPHMTETSSTQHLCVPSNSLGSNCYSTGNISFPVPQINSNKTGEQLFDPRLISKTVRRSLLALHRESQENINLLKKKDTTRSENDVHGGLKIKIKSKSKRIQNQQYRSHSNTLSILPFRTQNYDHDRPMTVVKENLSSCHYPRSTTPLVRRSLKNFPKYSTQSTSESEATQDLPLIRSIYLSVDDGDESSKTILETTEKTF